MKRALGWMMALGMGAALATGCVSRQEEGAKQVGMPHTPIQQKYKSPSASEAESGTGGAGGQTQSSDQLAMPDHWQDHPADSNRENANNSQGPYFLSQPQPVPRERRPAPLGVGAGVDSARKMAQDQLKSY